MAKLVFGDRIGREGKILTGCSAVIFGEGREKILLTRRTDNGLWCLPSGGMEPGESAAETCAREVLEETGLEVRIVRMVGVYSSPDILVIYQDGNKRQIVSLCFEAEVIGGSLRLSDETTAYGYFSTDEIPSLDLMENHRSRIIDAFSGVHETFIR